MILVTGSDGLIGQAFFEQGDPERLELRPFDLRGDPAQDTRNRSALAQAINGVEGVIHLAAVSRVVWAENNPVLTAETNIDALRNLIELMFDSPCKPWLIFASSREVYGEQDQLPVPEDAPLKPMNTYARSKVAGENLVAQAQEAGMLAQIVRFSNVYGTIDDHADRVVPAFARAAAMGGEIRVDGSGNTFDFTHVDDAARGLHALCDAVRSGEQLPPVHFLTGIGTSLAELAALAASFAAEPLTVREAPSRSFDVARFYGDPARARELLGWSAQVPLVEGMDRLVADFAAEGAIMPECSPLPVADRA